LILFVFDDSLIDVDAEELNVVLSSSGLENVDEEDDNILKSAMKLITIQMMMKMKIQTKYVVKPFFYDIMDDVLEHEIFKFTLVIVLCVL